ncbi:MAG: hypothetical protein ISS94_01995 [Candidatus Syntrophoarchaeum sp.]|nr:hypothetical protein [Candidatus Syntrophoarchaeum sp.]
MKKKNAALVVFLLSVAIAISVCVMPAFAKINCESDSTYDYNSSSAFFGEEIQAKVTINPGESEVKDMRIDILEGDALIDDNSFKHTIDPTPTGEDKRSVTREGHTLFCDELKRGESITLMFNAYPKTMKEKEIKVADVRISYTQLGQRLDEVEEIKAKLDNSVWFRYKDAEKRASSANWMFYVGLILAIIAGVSLFIQWWGKGKREKEKDEIKRNWHKNLEDISKKLELAKDNPTEMESLKRKVERDIKSIKIK